MLTEAAIAGRRDPLLGLKENVILGNMVPTGTGFRPLQRTRVKHNVEAPEQELDFFAQEMPGLGLAEEAV